MSLSVLVVVASFWRDPPYCKEISSFPGDDNEDRMLFYCYWVLFLLIFYYKNNVYTHWVLHCSPDFSGWVSHLAQNQIFLHNLILINYMILLGDLDMKYRFKSIKYKLSVQFLSLFFTFYPFSQVFLILKTQIGFNGF